MNNCPYNLFDMCVCDQLNWPCASFPPSNFSITTCWSQKCLCFQMCHNHLKYMHNEKLRLFICWPGSARSIKFNFVLMASRYQICQLLIPSTVALFSVIKNWPDINIEIRKWKHKICDDSNGGCEAFWWRRWFNLIYRINLLTITLIPCYQSIVNQKLNEFIGQFNSFYWNI